MPLIFRSQLPRDVNLLREHRIGSEPGITGRVFEAPLSMPRGRG